MPETVPKKYDPVLYRLQKDIGVRTEGGVFKLQKLKPIHKRIIAAHLSGMPSVEIAQLFNVHFKTIHTVINDPLAIAFMNEFDSLTRKEFDALRIRANAAIRDGLAPNQNIHTRLRAADQFSKRAGDYHPKPPEQQESAEDVIQRLLNLQINVQVNT